MESETTGAMTPETVGKKPNGVLVRGTLYKAVRGGGCEECSLLQRCGKRQGMAAPCLLFGNDYHFER